ncbi:NEDD8-conjugating protein ubc12 [Tieghemiomyces parasiticus]|uniref:NEDD8-conjugating enzyme UBC12 n=1 Tax=Tieghemiomyces parasiticus TaxID=78921 RepID=A0A9W8DKW1_9FUNG|nr:NEDD8-conjugating protein ubc12 [Tieghemiomyces parasiticus]
MSLWSIRKAAVVADRQQRQQKQQQAESTASSPASTTSLRSPQSPQPPPSPSNGNASNPQVQASLIRIQKDITELGDLPPTMTLKFPDPADLTHFTVSIRPDEKYYKGGRFKFDVRMPATYPHDPPRVRHKKRVFHPNIDLEGNICLNILREEWKPVLNLEAVLVGLQYLLLEPNPEDPLNKEAAQMLRTSPASFKSTVRSTMNGGMYNGIIYDRVL